MNTSTSTHPEDDRPHARVAAEEAAERWADVVRLQRWADPDHADFYALAAEIMATLQALDDLAHVLRRQVTGYGQGRTLYDDTRQVDPATRLTESTVELGRLVEYLQAAQAPANRFWSAIGHVGVEVTP
ncbi:hypothetical protein [Pseudonocardia charpentierae]|uniref:hypothetical protein n=1 Tax=Pseudonocardia charpentierae TaxID=3075545 RepID=UPI00288B09B4|nr:hypothetical protein [Pseudonocardia sp. DSM 45834]